MGLQWTGNRSLLTFAIALGVLSSLENPALGSSASPDLLFSGGTVLPGESIVTRVSIDHTLPDCEGWSLAICHDPAVLQLESHGLGATALVVNNGGEPDFLHFAMTDEGWEQGVVVNFIGGVFLPVGVQELAVAEYTAIAPGTSTFMSCMLDLPVPATTIIAYSGASIAPNIISDEVLVPPGPYFVRGDVNADGSVDVADGVAILNLLFGSAGAVPCFVAAETNGDGVVDIADPIALLTYLFSGGVPPVAPFPECGADPTAVCVAGSICP